MFHADVTRLGARRPLRPLCPAAVPRAVGHLEGEPVTLGAAVGGGRRVAGAPSALAGRRVAVVAGGIGELFPPRLVIAFEPI